MTVWAFVIFGSLTPQVVDLFPTKAECEMFRLNVLQMIVDTGDRKASVSDCIPRALR